MEKKKGRMVAEVSRAQGLEERNLGATPPYIVPRGV